MRLILRTASVLLTLITTANPVFAETVIKVPVTGSLADAVAKARVARANSSSPVVIELQAGVHRLREPVHLTEADSGTSVVSPLIIRSAPGAKAVLSGGMPLKRLPADPRLLARYPEGVRDKLAIFELPEQLRSTPTALIARRYDRGAGAAPFEVFDALGPLRPARWPNEGWAQGTAPKGDETEFRADSWKGAATLDKDVWLSGFPRHDWAYEVTRIDGAGAAGVLKLADAPVFGFSERFRFAILHNRADLDEPGEWHRDAASGRLVVWPRPDGGALEASVAPGLITMHGARHVTIAGLTLENVRGDAIFVRGGSHIGVHGVTIRNAGGRAVAFEGPTNSQVSRSHIHDTGDGGVILSGGDRATLTPGKLNVTKTIIERFARLGLSNRPGVSMHGVGNSVHMSLIADGPHIAIDFTGNSHHISSNEITRVVRETGDAGAIYTGRDWTAQGTHISANYLHDIRAGPGLEVKGVYLDDLASGILIHGNVFLRVDQPVFIGGGRDNLVQRNLFVASSPAVHIDGRGLTWMKDAVRYPTGQLRARFRDMPVASPEWMRRFPQLPRTLDDQPEIPKRNEVSNNQVIAGIVYRLLPEVDAKAQRLEPEADMRRTERQLTPSALKMAIDSGDAMSLGMLVAPLLPESRSFSFQVLDRREALLSSTPR